MTAAELNLLEALRRPILLGITLLMLFPLLYGVYVSLLDPTELFDRNASFWPPRVENYLDALSRVPFARYFLNSIVVCGLITAGTMLTGIMAAYAFARLRFRGSGLLFMAVIATLMIPSHVTLIPNYLTIGSAGLRNSYWALVLPFLASGFAIFFLRQHFRTIPHQIDDAARLDGASTWTILWRIIVPMSRPAIAAVAVFTFLSEWNAYIWPLIVTDSDDMRTVQIGLARLFAEDQEGGLDNWPLIVAASMMILVPPIAVFALFERHIVRGITMGGLQ